MKPKLRFLIISTLTTLFIGITTVEVAHAQVASAFLREGDTMPGGTSGNVITGLGNTAQNGIGGYAFSVTTDSSTSSLWGNSTGGAGTVLATESLIGTLDQTSFESFFGLADSGAVGHSAIADEVGGVTSLDGAWVNSTVVLNEEDAISAIPGNFSTFNSRVGITRGGTAYWVGGYSDTQGGSTQDRALFFGSGATVLLKGGDSISGVAELVSTNGIDFDFRMSGNGTNYISPIDVDSGSTTNDIVMVSNGAAITSGGGIIREESSIPTSIGGLAGELYDNFDFLGINEAGDYMITGDSDAATNIDEFVMLNGEIVLREGDSIGGMAIDGAIEGGYLNEDGDWAVIWDVVDGGANVEALILNGEVVLKETDLVDWNGDGIIDGADQGGFITNFTGISSLTLGDRDGAGNLQLMFTADVDVAGSILEGAFGFTFTTVPEPGTLAFLALASGLALTRRRRDN